MKKVLTGKRALVTGAAGGLGICVVRELALQGCNFFQDLAETDILVNCAGVYSEDFDECLESNLLAPYRAIKNVLPGMVLRRWGRVINVASAAAYRGVKGKAEYCSSKHAMLGLSRSLQLDLTGTGVRVVCVSPEAMQTPMGKMITNSGAYETFIKPESVARLIVQLIEQDEEMICEEVRCNRYFCSPAKQSG